MAHSGKTMTFATDLLPNEDNIYNLGNSTQKWKINGVIPGNARVFYGVCEDAGAAKTVVCPTYDSLQDGDVLFVNFTKVNTGEVANLTLNVNNKGARSIKYLINASDPANIPDVGYIRNVTYMFIYKAGSNSSTSYWIINIERNSNTWTALSTTAAGYVAKAPNDTTKFLRGDASWATLPSASSSTAGITTIGVDGGAATYNHTHTLSMATESTGTASLTLDYGKKYKLTAGGSTYIFGMPASDNSWRPIGTGATDAMAGNTVVDIVKQNKNADNQEFPILLKTTNNKESETGEVKFVQNEDVTVNPANGRISAPSFMVDAHVTLQWNSTDSSLDFIFA